MLRVNLCKTTIEGGTGFFLDVSIASMGGEGIRIRTVALYTTASLRGWY